MYIVFLNWTLKWPMMHATKIMHCALVVTTIAGPTGFGSLPSKKITNPYLTS